MNSQQILNQLNLSTVFFNTQGYLQNYSNIAKLWNVNEEFLQSQPYIVEFFEVLRENRIFPEKDDFRAYIKDIEHKCLQANSYQQKNNILLGNGKNIQEIQIKNEDGILFIWEDTTEVWDITYNLNNHKNIYTKIIEKHPQPLIVVASNGIVEGYNSKFAEAFNISQDILNNNPHIREVLDKLSIFNTLNNEKGVILGNILSSRSFNYSVPLEDSHSMNINGISLPNGQMFAVFSSLNPQNSTDVVIHDDNITKLHNDLIYDLNTVIGSPLANIIGFADLLANEYMGTLNIRQKEYIEKIIEKAEIINKELTYKIELSELESDSSVITTETVDLDVIIANLLHHIKPRIKQKDISIKLDIPESLSLINTNEQLMSKSFSLIMLYLIEQNTPKSEISITIEQTSNNTIFVLKDTSKEPLFSDYDLKNRYDINLALSIWKKLHCTFDFASKHRSHRYLKVILPKINSN